MKIQGIVKPAYYVDSNDLATKTRQLLRKNKVLFVMKENVFKGLIDRTTGLQVIGGKSTLTAQDIAKQPLYQTTPEDTIQHVAQKLLKYNTYIIPVFEDDMPIGYVGMSDILVILTLENERVSKMTLGDVMGQFPIFLESDDTVVKLWNTMEEISYSGVPIVKSTASRKDKFYKLVGYVSKKDLLNAGSVRAALDASNARSNPPKIEKVMNRTPVVLSRNDTVATFVEHIIQYDISRIPIVNEGYELEGIVGKIDVLKLLLEDSR